MLNLFNSSSFKVFLKVLSVIFGIGGFLHYLDLLDLRLNFTEMDRTWKLWIVYLAACDSLAALGLWRGNIWGVLLSIIVSVSQILAYTLYSQEFGQQYLLIIINSLILGSYLFFYASYRKSEELIFSNSRASFSQSTIATALAFLVYFSSMFLKVKGLPFIQILTILAFSYFLLGKNFLPHLGLKIPKGHIFYSIFILLVCTLIFRGLLPFVANASKVSFLLDKSLKHKLLLFADGALIELVFRAFLLGLLLQWINKPMTLAVGTGLCVGVIQYFLMYVRFAEQSPHQWLILLNFMFVSVALGIGYLRAGHLAYNIAIQGAWYLIRFGSTFQFEGHILTKAQSIPVIEGSPLVLGCWAVILAVLVYGAPKSQTQSIFSY